MDTIQCNDVILSLRRIMEKHTLYYQEDFLADERVIKKYAQRSEPESRRLLWLSRPHGTYCSPQREVYLTGTWANSVWTYYSDHPDGIVTYAVELNGQRSGKISGRLTKLDYPKHAERVKRLAMPLKLVSFTFEDGTKQAVPADECADTIRALEAKHGKETDRFYAPDDEGRLQEILMSDFPKQRHTRTKAPVRGQRG